jgi:hypothetical protein
MWFIIPNLIAQLLVTLNQAFYANIAFVFGNLIMIWHNYKIKDKGQILYFSVLEVLAILGIILYVFNIDIY